MQRLDLNLLITLDALLQERSVTRAAERLGLAQPTVSGSLARLRRHFGDDLLYRAGNTYQLTPLATHLASRSSVALDGVRRIFAAQSAFDPATSRREFTVACSDYGAVLAGPVLLAVIARDAPHVQVHLRQGHPGPIVDAEERLRSVDVLLMPHGVIAGLPHLDLYRDHWACVVAADNDSVGEQLTLEDLSRLPWVTTFRGESASSASLATGLRRLTQLGVQVRTQITLDAFSAVPMLVAGTERIALAPRRLAETWNRHGELRVLDPPFDAGPLVEAAWWHRDFERDVEHAWLRDRLRETAALLS